MLQRQASMLAPACPPACPPASRVTLCPCSARDSSSPAAGVQLVAVSTVANAKALLKSAIRSDNPIIFFEHVLLYNVKGGLRVQLRGSFAATFVPGRCSWWGSAAVELACAQLRGSFRTASAKKQACLFVRHHKVPQPVQVSALPAAERAELQLVLSGTHARAADEARQQLAAKMRRAPASTSPAVPRLLLPPHFCLPGVAHAGKPLPEPAPSPCPRLLVPSVLIWRLVVCLQARCTPATSASPWSARKLCARAPTSPSSATRACATSSCRRARGRHAPGLFPAVKCTRRLRVRLGMRHVAVWVRATLCMGGGGGPGGARAADRSGVRALLATHGSGACVGGSLWLCAALLRRLWLRTGCTHSRAGPLLLACRLACPSPVRCQLGNRPLKGFVGACRNHVQAVAELEKQGYNPEVRRPQSGVELQSCSSGSRAAGRAPWRRLFAGCGGC